MGSVTRTMSGASTTIKSSSTSTIVPLEPSRFHGASASSYRRSPPVAHAQRPAEERSARSAAPPEASEDWRWACTCTGRDRRRTTITSATTRVLRDVYSCRCSSSAPPSAHRPPTAPHVPRPPAARRFPSRHPLSGLPWLLQPSSRDHLGNQRTARHRRHTSLGAKSNLTDSPIDHSDRQLQNVAANRVLHPHPRIGIGKVACVTRMFEMIEQLRRIHSILSLLAE